MALFDDLSKKITEVSQTTIQKTKGFADTAKINSLIAEEEKKVKYNYSEIGRLYVSLHGDDAEAPYANLVQGAKDALARIDEYRRQISNIKGLIRCENCGNEIPPTGPFCSFCGEPVHIPVVQTNLCKVCGAALVPGAKFCTKCGTPTEQAEPLPPESGEPMKTCAVCSSRMPESSLFCTECGARF